VKTRVLLVAMVVLGVSASLALAAAAPGKGKPPATPGNGAQAASNGKGKPPTQGVGCRPRVMVVLRGTLASAPGAFGTSFSLNVTATNAQGKAYKTSAVTVAIDTKTMVRRNGAKDQASLLVGDRALVQARACKADLANGAKPALTATRIIAHPAKNL
jgi:hypothetical protein